MADLNLDALCDLLSDDEELGVDGNKEPVCSNSSTKDRESPSDVAEMENQLRLMAEQMKMMQQKLLAKKGKLNSQEEEVSSPPKEESQPRPDNSQKALKEINLFNRPEGSSFPAANCSPVKTNPFESCDRPVRLAKLNPETPMYGPALPKKITRVLSGEEREKFEQSLKERRQQKSLRQLSQDLEISSDEESNRNEDNPSGSGFNQYGKGISKLIKEPTYSRSGQDFGKVPAGFKSVEGSSINLSNPTSNKPMPQGVLVEKHSRIRISNPEINQVSFDLSLVGRKFIPVQRLKTTSKKEVEGDWATVGVVYYKTTQTSKNGNTYTLLKITDLQGDIETCGLYLFGRAHSKLFSLPLNRVIGILNPKVMDEKPGGSSRSEITLSVDHPDRILEMGDSLDVSRCQAKKNDGSGCTNLVNKANCEFCIYHVKKAYNSMSSKRGDLQSAFSGNAEVRARLMSKVVPKGELVAGGHLVNNRPLGPIGKPTAKQIQKDKNLLEGLGIVTCKPPPLSVCKTKVDKLLADTPGSRLTNEFSFHQPGTGKLTFRSHLSEVEREAVKKVASGVSEELGLKLLNPTIGARTLLKHFEKQDPKAAKEAEETSNMSKRDLESRLFSQKQQEAKKLLMEQKQQHKSSLKSSPLNITPKLGKGYKSGGFVDLNSPSPTSKTFDPNKLKAILALRGKSLKKEDPNNSLKRKRSEEDLVKFQRKVAAKLDEKEPDNSLDDENLEGADKRFLSAAKEKRDRNKPKEIRSLTGELIDEKKMAELRKKRSLNHNLAEEAETEAEEKYFDGLERKEAMEEKMLNTKEIETTAYTCKICNYTATSQSEYCRNSNHFAKKIKVTRKFFECAKCKNRTTSFDRLPKTTCTKCGESSWRRTSMIRERKGPLLDSEQLSIRGVEQKFVNGNATCANLDLDF